CLHDALPISNEGDGRRHMMPMHGGPGMATVRGLSRDRSVARHRLAPGTFRRILGFARPYRMWIVAFVALILFEAVLGAATPLVYREIIDVGIAERDRKSGGEGK